MSLAETLQQEAGLCPPSPFYHTKREASSCVVEKEAWSLIASDTLTHHRSEITVSESSFPKEVLSLINAMPMGRQHVVAGGSVRDMLLGNSVSDYDIYTTMSVTEAQAFLHHYQGVANDFTPRFVVPNGAAEVVDYKGNVRYIIEFYVDGVDERIELIGVDNVEDYVCREFSVGTSRVMFHPRKGFYATLSFLLDIATRCITIKNADNLTEKYKRKMKIKFNGWEWKV